MLTIDQPELEARLQEEAARRGVDASTLTAQLIEERLEELLGARWQENDEVATHYAESLATQGEFTASTHFQEDLHQYGAEELAAMERGEFHRPLR